VSGELTVVDTNNRRVATFDITGDRIGGVVRSFSTTVGLARPGREWPFAAARLPDGGMWVAVAAEGMKDADMILFSAQGKPLQRAQLGSDSDPWAVAYWNGRVLVADARAYRVASFRPDGSEVGEFHEAQFDRELKDHQLAAIAWDGFRKIATVGMVAFPMLGIFILWRMGVPLGSLTAAGQGRLRR
jgi:hypothetical protein